MTYYVYILESLTSGFLYKGYTTDYIKRLEQHNNGESRYTSLHRPWKLVYVEICINKTSALKREKQLKRANKEYLRWLIKQPSNILLPEKH
jgi:putative endonuclease